MTEDLRTLSERLRDEKHKSICERYKELQRNHPDVRPYRYMHLISNEFNMTVPGIRHILEKHGLYSNKD